MIKPFDFSRQGIKQNQGYKDDECPNCEIKDVEIEQCDYCLNWFCCQCIDEHKKNCPERDD